jgi:HlyD family secretion protein
LINLLKNHPYLSITALLLLITLVYMGFKPGADDTEITVEVTEGDFEITVFTTGELEAKNSVSIDGPTTLRQFNIWQIKISDLVPEGTVVKKGDYVAALDKTEVSTKIKDTESELDKITSQFIQTKLDTTLQMRQSRDELINTEYEVQQKKIVLEQSAFEPPATIRQAQLDVEKSERSLAQLKRNYKVKEAQLSAKMQEVSATLAQTQRKLESMTDILSSLTITAPEDGMVIYERDWSGKKKKVGDMVGVWEPTVANLPDLSKMITRTYVNEVDIQKIKTKQKVAIQLDAFPEKKLTGIVTEVANVGEQNPKSEAKVFEVIIQINEKDTSLRPAMTTGNKILVGQIPKSIYVPLEAIHNQGDSLSYVFVHQSFGAEKRQVLVGKTNDNHAQILSGLEKKEKVFLSVPKGADKLSMIALPVSDSKRSKPSKKAG